MYIVCSGRVKLSVEAKDGKTVILKVVGERQVLGLSALVSGQPSPIEATTVELCQIKFVDRESFLRLIDQNSHAALACARLLSHEIGTTFRDVHCCWRAVRPKSWPGCCSRGRPRNLTTWRSA